MLYYSSLARIFGVVVLYWLSIIIIALLPKTWPMRRHRRLVVDVAERPCRVERQHLECAS